MSVAKEIDSQKRKASSDVNCLQDALKEEVKISVENRNAIDSTEPTESNIDKVDSEKIEAKKSVEIAIDSIEPTETKRAKVDSKSEKIKLDIKIEPELCSDQNPRSNQKSSNTDRLLTLQFLREEGHQRYSLRDSTSTSTDAIMARNLSTKFLSR